MMTLDDYGLAMDGAQVWLDRLRGVLASRVGGEERKGVKDQIAFLEERIEFYKQKLAEQEVA